MKLKWLGHASFLVRSNPFKKEVLILLDPFSEKIGLSFPKVQPDICLISHFHFDHCNLSSVLGKPFIITDPGEYEKEGVFIKGISAFHDKKEGKERGRVVIYKIKAEGINLLHMGDFGQSELTLNQLEEIGKVDLLMIPTGGVYTIGPKEALKIISQIDPKIVIPMHYKISPLKINLEKVDKFLKLTGEDLKEKKKISSLSLNERFLEGKRREVIVMKRAKL